MMMQLSFACLFLFGLLQPFPVTCGARTLRMVNVVYRHGDRSPTHIFPTDQYADYWPQGMGQLTQKGMRQEYHLGNFLKERYVKNFKLLNSSYIFKDIYVRSSDLDRCLMSAQTQLNGLYPPHGFQVWRDDLEWQPIGIHVVPKKEDYLLRPFDFKCPRFFQLLSQDKNQVEYQEMQANYSDMLAYVSKNTGEEIDVSTTFKIKDPIVAELSHNLPLPAWILNGSTLTDLYKVCDFGFYWNFNTREKARLTGGALVGQMIENMKGILGTDPVKKIYIYSAHDTTLVAFLSAMQVFDRIAPDYSSAVVLELYSDASDPKRDLTVQIQYRFGQSDAPTLLRVPQCEEDCPLDEFIKLMDDVIPEDIYKECGLKEECSCEKDDAVVEDNKGKKMLEEKNGYVQSFSKKLEEHTASTTTLSESSDWVIENIISDWKSEGCFNFKRNVFPKVYHKVQKVNRKTPNVTMIFDQCKKMAKIEGYEIFAIRKVNSCVTSLDGKKKAFKTDGQSSQCAINDSGRGVGIRNKSVFVYTG